MVIDGQIVVRPMMFVALTYDNRIVDGQRSAQFVCRSKGMMEEPGAMPIAQSAARQRPFTASIP